MRPLVLTFLLVAVVAGCGGDEEKSAETTTVTTTVAEEPVTTGGRSRYPDVIVNNYMRSCTKGDRRKRAYCGCTLDKLSEDVSVADFARVGQAGGKLPPRMQRLIREAAVACADKL
jgi:hypothetical protein